MTQRKFLNLGSGKITLPCEQPAHHALIDPAIYTYALWHNVDKNGGAGVDECVDVFTYPFKWSDSSFDGALLAHIVEHVPHEVRKAAWRDDAWYPDSGIGDTLYQSAWKRLSQLPDGFYCFFAELHRVLTNGAIAHILVPYAFSNGAMQDPTHHRYLTPNSFTYLVPNPNAPFELVNAGEWQIEEVKWGLTENAVPYQHDHAMLQRALDTQLNIASEFYVKLRVVK